MKSIFLFQLSPHFHPKSFPSNEIFPSTKRYSKRMTSTSSHLREIQLINTTRRFQYIAFISHNFSFPKFHTTVLIRQTEQLSLQSLSWNPLLQIIHLNTPYKGKKYQSFLICRDWMNLVEKKCPKYKLVGLSGLGHRQIFSLVVKRFVPLAAAVIASKRTWLYLPVLI